MNRQTHSSKESISSNGQVDLFVSGLRIVHDGTELLNEELKEREREETSMVLSFWLAYTPPGLILTKFTAHTFFWNPDGGKCIFCYYM